ncbi:hypothetical protein M595_5765 [Lyngbya aestuarii BL J]|uniref:Uncharacterized protein n=1 Tax=Lyngbya aestuarii BL J TaxID=1348334 RepID=U7QB74_9CYAN|nr:hypothetical protein [Lyngbya aestuarii]ERT04295.1 hypothetical protein M595_5765 [Lyngbya aestuarii BL J]
MKIKHISQFPYGSNTREGLLFFPDGKVLTKDTQSSFKAQQVCWKLLEK